ncbi:MAG: GNAT family N-acetyltransferase [Actinocatenispora sp.]
MTPGEYEKYMDRSVREYAEDKTRSGEYPPETAEERSRAEFDQLLPNGLDTPGMLLFSALDTDAGPTDQPVGLLWLALPGPKRRQAWVFELWIEPGCRGLGYGRAIMLAGERELAARDVGEVGLNVFGHNEVAIGLYRSLGYRVTSQQMSKSVPAG